MQCPKCGYSKVSGDTCEHCGIIFSKYQEAQERKKSQQSKKIEVTPATRITHVSNNPQFWKPVTTGEFAGLSFIFVSLSYQLYSYGPMGNGVFLFLLHNINLVFHEAGHFILMGLNFGRIPVILGGTFGQLAIPLVVAIGFFRERDRNGFAFAGFWFFENFLDIAVYMADSRVLVLPLLGGSGEEGHDWRNLFLHWGVLHKDTVIAGYFEAMGWAGMTLFWFWLSWSWTTTKGGETNPPP